jgi:hypothetical protein
VTAITVSNIIQPLYQRETINHDCDTYRQTTHVFTPSQFDDHVKEIYIDYTVVS